MSSKKRCPRHGGSWTLSEGIFDLKTLTSKISSLEKAQNQPAFWIDPTAGHLKLRELSRLKGIVEPLERLKSRVQDLEESIELLELEPDKAFEKQVDAQVSEFIADLEAYELKTLLKGEHDGRNALLEINAGAGGSEACDWAAMLLRLYTRWAQRNGFKVESLSETPGDVTGYRNVSLAIKGENAYGYLKSEHGVHRLVRISPFDAASRRHTSFVRIEILPEIEPTEVDINPDDLRIDTLRASGAGGQHVNKTESAVRITHIPSGIVVNCQNERSQHKNRASAMLVLTARLAERLRIEDANKLSEIRGETGPAEWGRQIRSYVMQPYTMVKDHRTGTETGNVLAVLDGEIDTFIESFLRQPPKNSETFIE